MMNIRNVFLPLILAALGISSCVPIVIQTDTESDLAPQKQTQPENSFASLQPGASIRFQKISIDEGLAQSVVNVMAQDQMGFIWFGTQDGLNRYDGYHFQVYKPDPNDPSSLSDAWITALLADTDGSIWVGTTQGGVNRYDPQTGKFTRYQHNPDDTSSITEGKILSIYRDQQSNLWVSTSDGLNRFESSTNTFTHLLKDEKSPASINSNMVSTIFQDSSGRLWFGTDEGLNLYDPANKNFSRSFSASDDPGTLSDNIVFSMAEDRNANLWVGTSKGLNKFDPASGKFIRYLHDPNDPNSLGFNKINDLWVDSDNILWIATNEGLDRYDPSADQFSHYRNDRLLQNSLSTDVVFSILEDREGMLWFGTWGGGVNKYDRAQNQFAFYRNDPKNPDSLNSDSVFPIFADQDGIVWMGIFNNGLERFDPATGIFTHYDNDPNNPDSLNGLNVWSIARDKEGFLWLGTDMGLDQFDEQNKNFIHHTFDKNDPGSINADYVDTVYVDRADNIWIGTENGLDRYDRETEKFIHYSKPGDEEHKTPTDISRISEDHLGNLWINTTSVGLYYFDVQTNVFKHFIHETKNPNSLASDITLWAYEDAQNLVWIATAGGGLNKYNPAEETFTRYTEQQGLANNFLYCVVPDDEGFLWMASNYGVSRFDPTGKIFRNYTAEDGLQSNEFNSYACARANDGSLYVGGLSGFNHFIPKEILPGTYQPPLVVTSLTSEGKPVSINTSPEMIRTVTLKSPQNSFEFEFAALSFSKANKIQYSYKLEGFDSGWYYAGENRTGRYSNLPGGKYTLRVKAANAEGVWIENEIAVKVTVIPPFWQTWWFYSLAALTLIAGVFGTYRYRVHNVEIQKRELERQVNERAKEIERLFEKTKDLAILEERNRLARDLHDSAKQKAFAALAELGTARSLFNGSKEKSVKHLQEAETLVGEVIQEITFLIQEIHPAALKEKGLASTLREYVFEWSNRTGIHVDLKIEGEQRLSLEIEQALYRSIQEALANVTRHSAANSVSIVLIIQQSDVNVSVSDNGRGFELNRTPNGMGLRSIRERVESVGGRFNIESTAGQGTRLELQIPLKETS